VHPAEILVLEELGLFGYFGKKDIGKGVVIERKRIALRRELKARGQEAMLGYASARLAMGIEGHTGQLDDIDQL
jgi:hypothetical protein